MTIVGDWNSTHRIPYNSLYPFYYKIDPTAGVKKCYGSPNAREMTIILEIPDEFDNGHVTPPTTALSLVCFRLAWSKRYKACIETFNRERSWLCTSTPPTAANSPLHLPSPEKT